MYSKSDRAAGPLCEHALALVLGGVEEGEVPGAELAVGGVSKFAGLRRDHTERADGKGGHAPRVASANPCLDGTGGIRERAGLRIKLFGGLVVVAMNLARALRRMRQILWMATTFPWAVASSKHARTPYSR